MKALVSLPPLTGFVPLLCLALLGCGGIEQGFLASQQRSAAVVSDDQGRSLGVAGVLRVGRERALLVLGRPPTKLPDPAQPLYVTLTSQAPAGLGEEPEQIQLTRRAYPVFNERRPGLTLLEVEPGEADVRPLIPAAPDAERGEEVLVLGASDGPWLELWSGELEDDGSGRQVVDVRRLIEESRPVDDEPDLGGALVFRPDGALVGVAALRADGQLQLIHYANFADLVVRHAGERGGSDVLAPGDARVHLRISLDEVRGLPELEDDWGGADLHLLLRQAGARSRRPLGTIRVSDRRQRLFEASPGPLQLALIERDVSSFTGVVDQPVAGPLEIEPLSAQVQELRLPYVPELAEMLAPTPRLDPTPLDLPLSLRVEAHDAEARSGADRTPFGAPSAAEGALIKGLVDVEGQDATDFWLLDVEQLGPAVVFLLRRDERASLSVEGFTPSFRRRLLDLDTQAALGGSRLLLSQSSAALPPGRLALRIRQQSGPPCRYTVAVVPADQPQELVRLIFKAIGSEADGHPYLFSRELAREVAQALNQVERSDPERNPELILQALLEELGGRLSRANRHLALRLLEVHQRPRRAAALGTLKAELSRILEQAGGDRRVDAGLLLASLGPPGGDLERIKAVIRQCADPEATPDPLIRLRALAAIDALRGADAGERGDRLELTALFQDDPSPRIQRALARSR